MTLFSRFAARRASPLNSIDSPMAVEVAVPMSDLLIRDIDSELKRQLEESAQRHSQSLSDEAKLLIRKGLNVARRDRKLGSEMFDSILPEDRGDDLVFEYRGDLPKPPDFE